MSKDRKWICVGEIGAPRGVSGEVRLRAYTEPPLAVGEFDDLRLAPEFEPVRIRSLEGSGSRIIARMEGVDDRSAAEALRGRRLFVSRAALPMPERNEFYLADLEGLEAVDREGRPVGRILGIANYGAGDLVALELQKPEKGLGREVFLPFRRDLFPAIDIEAGTATVVLEDWLAAIGAGLEGKPETARDTSK